MKMGTTCFESTLIDIITTMEWKNVDPELCNIISFSFFCNRTLDSIKPIGNSTFDEVNARLLII